MEQDVFLGIVEGLLFAVGEDGISTEEIEEVIGLGAYEVSVILGQLKTRYEDSAYGLMLIEVAGVYKMVTKKEHAPYFKKLLESPHQKVLTEAALEVLAIVAYKQPITRGEIEGIRGVNNDSIIKKLLMFNLIEEAGRAKVPGRPILFRTTAAFLDYFGMKTLDELPEIDEDKLFGGEEDLRLFKD